MSTRSLARSQFSYSSYLRLALCGVVALAVTGLSGSASAADDPVTTAKENSKKRDVSEFEAQPAKASKKAKPTKPTKRSSAHVRYRDFGLTGEWQLYMNRDRQSDARLFHSQSGQAWLILDSGFPGGEALVFDAADRSLYTLSAKGNFMPAKNVLDILAIRADADFKKVGAIEFEAKPTATGGKSMGWSFEDKDKKINLRLRPSGHFRGLTRVNKVLEFCPQYNRVADTYRRMVEKTKRETEWLKDLKLAIGKIGARKINISVYFGSWCPVCKQVLGKIVYLDRTIDNIAFSYYGLPKEGYAKDKEWIRNKLEKLPTVTVKVDGKEIGRGISLDWDRPIVSMLSVVQRYDVAKKEKTAKK